MILFIIFIIIIISANVLGFFLIKSDKNRSIYNSRRIPEKAYIYIALLGGGVGVYLSCRRYRHKTRHIKFMVLIPAIIIMQLFLIALIVYLLT